MSRPASPVLTPSVGSISSAWTSPSAIGQYSTHDEQLAWRESHVAGARLDGQLADDEQLVSVLVGVPDELALDLHDLDLVVV